MNATQLPLADAFLRMVNLLREVETDPTVVPKTYLTDSCDKDGNEVATDPRIEEIVSLADMTLITSSGQPRWAAHNLLSSRGFRVRPGETDGFG